MTLALALAALSAAVSAGISYGMMRAALVYIEKQLGRMEAELKELRTEGAANSKSIAVIESKGQKQ
jgi:hypothetical protein